MGRGSGEGDGEGGVGTEGGTLVCNESGLLPSVHS